MNSYLSISHLIRHFLLFVFTVVFLLTLSRAGFNLWQLHQVSDAETLVRSFVQGLRFDVATIGMLMLVPVVVVPLLAMFRVTLPLARLFTTLWMMLALLLILLLELLTPYFLHTASVRPDVPAFQDISNLLGVVNEISQKFLIPTLIGAVLLLMLLYAFWVRMETNRYLRFPIRKLPAILFCLIGFLVCVVAIRSSVDPRTVGLGPDAALISATGIVNEIALNSTFKTLHSIYNAEFVRSVVKLPELEKLLQLLPKN